jgi:YidC/Oxa1 family membrane protein insertase
MSKKLLNYLLIFLSISLILQVFFVKPEVVEVDESNPVVFETRKQSYPTGKVVDLKITNNTADVLVFPSSCPNEPFKVFYTSNEPDIQKTHESEVNCEDSTDPSAKDLRIKPGKTQVLRYTYWSSSLFDETGRYKIMANLNIDGNSITAESNEFEIRNRNFFGKIWISGFYQPIYNFLVFLIDVLPGHHLGLAIILLTLILRLLLFVPSHKALRSQKKMAEIQPQLNEIKKKYKDNQQIMAAKTMEVWKEHGVSPASSCLPLLIQFPILIALFYVIQDGLNPDKTYLLYKGLADFNINTIQTMFLGLDLKARSLYLLPIIVGGLQFLQLHLAQKKKPAKEDGIIDVESSDKKEAPKKSEAEAVQGMMLYFMPAMIAVFTASLPAGVGLYWGTSTLFSIVQQLFINTEKPSKPKKKKTKKVKEKDITKIKI